MYDYSELRGKIKAKFKTESAFAKAMGFGVSTLSKKLNNHVDWAREEIRQACDLLGIPLIEVSEYFFYPVSCENTTEGLD